MISSNLFLAMVIKELILPIEKSKNRFKEIEDRLEEYIRKRVHTFGSNRLKVLIWSIAFLTFGILDWATTYYITVILDGVEKNHFLQITGLHEQYIGFIVLKGLGLLLLLIIAEFVHKQSKEHEVDIPGVYYFVPLFLIILGINANLNNIAVIMEYV